jgi:mannose-6-phosphate isomerase-like protein (cupin superfamily)
VLKAHQRAVLVDFPALPWVKVEGGGAAGRAKKKIVEGGRSVRVLEVSPRWNEVNWCARAHVGYVTSGRLRLEFEGQVPMNIGRGMGFWIPPGCPHRASCSRTTTLFMVD